MVLKWLNDFECNLYIFGIVARVSAVARWASCLVKSADIPLQLPYWFELSISYGTAWHGLAKYLRVWFGTSSYIQLQMHWNTCPP